MNLLKRVPRAWILAALGAVALFVAAWAWVPASPAPGSCPFSRNAAWIGVAWTSRPVDPAAVASLARDARDHRLAYLFAYTTYLRADDTFNPTFDFASDFVVAYREANPDTRLLAWIGLPLANDRPFGIQGWVDLNDAEQRGRIVAFAADLVAQAGFDGVHIDAETVRDGDLGALLLLEETREALGPDAILSVAGSYWLPGVLNGLPPLRGHKWSPGYIRQVAARVDQIAAMTYDSVMPHPALYRLWLREQTRVLERAVRGTDAVRGAGAELLIGIPASRERTQTHHPYAENVRAGLAGACAHPRRSTDDAVTGLALYPAWEVTPADWADWDRAIH